MKRLYFFILSLGLIAATASAQNTVLTAEQALQRFSEQKTNAPARARALAADEPQQAATLTQSGLPTAYVFNLDKGGYLVLSADTQSPALLGYSDHGAWADGKIASALQWWLDDYGRQIDWQRTHATAPRSSVVVKSTTTRSAILPMTATRWNQDEPYNDLCPESDGTRCVTGCVATAMAQVLKYHNWPTVGEGTHSYSWTDPADSTAHTLTFDYGATEFYWDKMLNVYSSLATEGERLAVATLMYGCGVSVDMAYTTTGSGAESFAVIRALTENLRYAKSVQFLQRNYYTLEGWETVIYDQLAYGGPLIYGGESGEDGHEFVCDGYSSDGYFHFNWGWGGMSDGYFLLDALDPGQQGIGGSAGGYNFAQDIIVGIEPERGQRAEVVPNMCFASDFTLASTSAALGSEIEPTYTFYSYSAGAVSVTPGIMILSTDGARRYVAAASGAGDVNPGYGVEDQTLAVVLPSDLAEGTYTVWPAFKSGEVWYEFHQPVSSVHYYTMTVSGSEATLQPQSQVTISVSDVTLNSGFYTDTKFSVSANMINEASREYYGVIYGALLADEDGSWQLADVAGPELADVSANSGQDFDYVSEFTHASAGSYYFCFVTPSGSDGEQFSLLSEPVAVTVQEAPTDSQVYVGAITFSCGNQTQVPRNNIGISVPVECTSGIFYGSITYVIFEQSGSEWGSVDEITSDPIFITGPASSTVTIEGEFTQGEIGKTYGAAIYINGHQMTNLYEFTLTGDSTGLGVDAVESRRPVATTLYNLQGVRIDANAAPGMYIKVSRYADGTSTSEKVRMF